MKILKVLEKRLRNKNYSERSVNIYSCYIGKFLQEINVKDPYQIRLSQIERYLINKNFTSVSQQNQYIGALKLFSKYILNKSDLHLSKIERPRKEKSLPRVIDKDHIIASLSKITNLKHKSILSIAYSTGLRVSEVINLKIKDIDSSRMIITIRQSKGNKDRIVPLTNTILNLLRDYFIKFRPKEYLFNGQSSLKYSTTSCNKLVKKYLGEDYHFHLLRHSAFTNLTDQGVDIRVIQKLAGHSSCKTTEIYTHVSKNILSNLPLAL